MMTIPGPLVVTKLDIPRVQPNRVLRQRLVQRLDESFGCGLTLLSAPAGSGKTTLLSEWVQQCQRPVAWVLLDEGDNDPARFLMHVLTAAQRVQPGMGEAVLALLRTGQPVAIEPLFMNLVNDLACATSNWAIALDDYQAIETEAIQQGMAFLIEHSPPNLHWILISRVDPPLPLARLRARRHLLEIRAADLRFTLEEAATYLNQVMGLQLAASDVAALEAHTEGWIAGLQLAALSLRGRVNVAELIDHFTGSHRYVADYLLSEVFQRQPESIRSFLLQTAILDRLTAGLCSAVTGRADSQAVLEWLESANLFVIPLDDRRQWYRYHHLFADFLRARAELSDEMVAERHRRAATWYEHQAVALGAGWLAEAVEHALAGRDFEYAARLVEQAGLMVFKRNEIKTLTRWLEALPEDIVRRRPQICLLYAFALISSNRFEAAELRLEQAELAIRANASAEEVRRLRGEIAATRSSLAAMHNQVPQVIALANQALETLPADDLLARGAVLMSLGTAYIGQHDLLAAAQTLRQAADSNQDAGNLYVAVSSLCTLAYVQVIQNQLHQARTTYEEAIQLAQPAASPGQAGESSSQPLPVVGWAYIGLSNLYYEWNDLATAERIVTDGIALCERWGYLDFWLLGYTFRAQIEWARHGPENARAVLGQVEEIARRYHLIWGRAWAATYQAHLWLVEGELGKAGHWADTCNPEATLDMPNSAALLLDYVHEIEYLTLVRIRLAQGRAQPDGAFLGEALAVLDRLDRRCETAGLVWRAIQALALRALVYQAQGKLEQGLQTLERALALAEPEGHIRMFVDEGPAMADLLHQVQARGYRRGYVNGLLAAFRSGSDPRPIPKDEHRRPAGSAPADEHADDDLIPADRLSSREIEVLRLAAAGLSDREIATALTISIPTVKSHLRHIYEKLHVPSRTKAVARAREMGVLGNT